MTFTNGERAHISRRCARTSALVAAGGEEKVGGGGELVGEGGRVDAVVVVGSLLEGELALWTPGSASRRRATGQVQVREDLRGHAWVLDGSDEAHPRQRGPIRYASGEDQVSSGQAPKD